jgi:polyisoprenyl-phosphate glycosyltransferase
MDQHLYRQRYALEDRGPALSVVVPVLNEELTLPALRERLHAALADLDYEVVVVDDGSSDASVAIVESWVEAGEPVRLVELSRNFGMEVAMSAGLEHAEGSHVVLMHADLQDPPELIPEMLSTAHGGADVVYARRIGRDESLLKRKLATGFYALMSRLARTPYQGQAGDFRLMSRRVVDALREMPEQRRFLRGMVAWVGFEQVPIEYRRAGRVAGRGASYRALFRLALEALVSFSDVPLTLATIAGTTIAVLATMSGFAILAASLLGWVTPSLGLSTLITLLFLSGVQLISVGILGRYLARVHDQALGRPLYVVERVVDPGLLDGESPDVSSEVVSRNMSRVRQSEPERTRPSRRKSPLTGSSLPPVRRA